MVQEQMTLISTNLPQLAQLLCLLIDWNKRKKVALLSVDNTRLTRPLCELPRLHLPLPRPSLLTGANQLGSFPEQGGRPVPQDVPPEGQGHQRLGSKFPRLPYQESSNMPTKHRAVHVL